MPLVWHMARLSQTQRWTLYCYDYTGGLHSSKVHEATRVVALEGQTKRQQTPSGTHIDTLEYSRSLLACSLWSASGCACHVLGRQAVSQGGRPRPPLARPSALLEAPGGGRPKGEGPRHHFPPFHHAGEKCEKAGPAPVRLPPGVHLGGAPVARLGPQRDWGTGRELSGRRKHGRGALGGGCRAPADHE